jgi:multiple sugar transport system substrate-binding protein
VVGKTVSRRQLFRTGMYLAGAGALAACGATPTPQVVTETVVVKETVVVEATQASQGPLFLIYASQNSAPPFNEGETNLVNSYEEQNPGVKVKVQTWPGQDVHDKLRILATAGDLPDAFDIETKQYTDMVYRNMILDITELFNTESGLTKDDYWDGEWEKMWFNGKMYIVSLDTQGAILFYNKDLFDKKGIAYPPKDWTDKDWTYEKMIEVATELTEGEGVSKVWGLDYTRWWPYMYPIIWSYGGTVVSADQSKSTMTMAETVEAHQLRADFELKYGITPTPSQTTEGTGTMFNSGRIAMGISSSPHSWEIKDVPGLNWDIAVMPAGPAGRFSRAPQDGVCVSSQTKHPKDAFKLAIYMAGPEGQQVIDSQLGLGLPTLRKVAEADDYIHPKVAGLENLDQTPVVEMFRGKYYKHQDITIKWPEMLKMLSADFDNVLDGKETAEEFCAKMDPQVTELLQSIPEEYRGWIGD